MNFMSEKFFFRIRAKIKKITNDITVMDNWKCVSTSEKGFRYAFIM